MYWRERLRRSLPVLAAALGICLSPMAQARPQHGASGEPQGRQAKGEQQERRGKAAGFASALGAMVQACRQEAVDLKAMRLDVVERVVHLDAEQRSHLERVRSAGQAAADALNANCPNDVGTRLSEKISTLDHTLQLMADSLKSLHPALASFYSLLGDEPKAQLVAMTLAHDHPPPPQRRSTGKQGAADDQSDARQKSQCLPWASNLKSWPVRQIESATALSDFQRASLYELTAAIYRSAGDLAQACPAANPLTPLGRLEVRESQLRALQQDMQAIEPFAAAFENGLNDDQQKELYAAIGISTRPPQTVGSAVVRPRPKQSLPRR
ncbi:MAG TPA: Spy/CpxP family protein refolding chaperone [Xanthobacteraceae bacterium]|jgi:hypothetical protein